MGASESNCLQLLTDVHSSPCRNDRPSLQPPKLEILEVSDMSEERFKAVIKVQYDGDGTITLTTKVCALWGGLRLRDSCLRIFALMQAKIMHTRTGASQPDAVLVPLF